MVPSVASSVADLGGGACGTLIRRDTLPLGCLITDAQAKAPPHTHTLSLRPSECFCELQESCVPLHYTDSSFLSEGFSFGLEEDFGPQESLCGLSASVVLDSANAVSTL